MTLSIDLFTTRWFRAGTPAAQKHPEYMKRMLPIQQEGADTLLVPAVFPQASNKSSLKPAESWALPCHFAILSSVSRGFATMDPVGGKGTVEKTLPSDQKPKRIIEVPLIMTAARHMLEWCYGVAPKAADLKLVEAFQLALLSKTLGVPGQSSSVNYNIKRIVSTAHFQV